MKKLLLLAEEAWTIVALTHYAGAPLLLILSDGASEGEEGDDARFVQINILFMLIYLITFGLLLLRWKKVIPFIVNNKLVWMLFGLITISFFWSEVPDLTRTRIIAMFGTMMMSLYLASRYTLQEQLKLIAWVFGAAIVGSFLFCILLPKYGTMGGLHAGAWRGVFNHKNSMGKIMGLSSIVFLVRSFQVGQRQWMALFFLSGSIGLLVMSKSSSPMLNLAMLVIVFGVLHTVRWNYLFSIPALMGIATVAITAYTIVAPHLDSIVGSFGKDLTLTGRTNFWPLIVDKIWENPILGYGFGAFWNGLDGPSAYVWNASAFKAPNAHNGYLDLCLELGLVGLCLYGIIFISNFYKSLLYIRHVKAPNALWPALFSCHIILANTTESSLIIQNNLVWIIHVTIFLSLDSALKNGIGEREALPLIST